MLKYQYSETYDDTYQINNKEIACYSKSEMREMYPDGNYSVFGETILKNKKDTIDSIELGKVAMNVSKEGSHSRLFFKVAGYVEDISGEYIILLKRRWLLLWIFLGLLLLLALLFFLREPAPVPAPDTSAVETDTVYISLPYGNVDYRMANDITELAGSDMQLYMTHDGKEDFVHRQKIELEKDGDIADGTIDFPILTFELKVGDYAGRMVYATLKGETVEFPVNVKVLSANTGTMTIGYSTQITVDKASGDITLKYEQGEDATHDVILQIILLKEGREYLLAQSGTVRAGDTVTKLKLDSAAGKQIPSGSYDGYIRVYIIGPDDVPADTGADIEMHISVK